MKIKKMLVTLTAFMLGTSLVLAGCFDGAVEENVPNNTVTETKGAEYTKLLSGTDWQGTTVKDAAGTDLTTENANFIGLAKYDGETNYYEFFDKETKATRGDEGTFFVTADGTKRILISTSNNYQAVVDITQMTKDVFTYKRQGKDKAGNDVEVFVEHIPYTESALSFTNKRDEMTTTTGTIETAEPGRVLLGSKLWNGTVVKDANGNDVTDANQMFISLAKFDADTNRYEFFNLETGETRGDYGYYDVILKNKIRTHVSLGENKYGAVLELTELNPQRFTYKRTGKDANGNDIDVFVEHEPYTGSFNPTFTTINNNNNNNA